MPDYLANAPIPNPPSVGSTDALLSAHANTLRALAWVVPEHALRINYTMGELGSKQPLDADLTALAALSGTGLVARTGAGAFATRTLAVGSNLSVSNGNGVSGNPTISLGTAVPIQSSGAWTPTLEFGGGSSGMAGTFAGSYVQVGSIVVARYSITLTNRGSSTGSAVIGGLPANFAGDGFIGAVAAFNMSGLSSSIVARGGNGTNRMQLRQQGASDASQLTQTHFSNSTLMIGSIAYAV